MTLIRTAPEPSFAIQTKLCPFPKNPCLALLLTGLSCFAYVPGQSLIALRCNPAACQEGTLPAAYLWPFSGLNSVKPSRSKPTCSTHQSNFQPRKLMALPFAFMKGAALRTWGFGPCQAGVLWEGGGRMQEGV